GCGPEVSFPPRQVQVVALLPDLLVYNNHSLLYMLPSMETFNGVLLCVEITGEEQVCLWQISVCAPFVDGATI
uniref:Uncharacterized protein n=1 Tax=Gopherus evgoodei TaxID=1825980 RepID=A0A8C4VRT8_9SAUR